MFNNLRYFALFSADKVKPRIEYNRSLFEFLRDIACAHKKCVHMPSSHKRETIKKMYSKTGFFVRVLWAGVSRETWQWRGGLERKNENYG